MRSAVASTNTPGVFITAIPRVRAAAISMLSNPTAMLATMRSCGPAAMTIGSLTMSSRSVTIP